jgi:hypothetical protein
MSEEIEVREFINIATDEELEEMHKRYIKIVELESEDSVALEAFLITDILAQEIAIRYLEKNILKSRLREC